MKTNYSQKIYLEKINNRLQHEPIIGFSASRILLDSLMGNLTKQPWHTPLSTFTIAEPGLDLEILL